ncbi:hypothetical protein J8J14_14475 [Roseomonas sp. SSH11]|uniref:Uncharacterized protein n=1 Tax=Pararoseomonas baculiformis TaxID=2820812 RepID=A0ABS4AG29_9PROT|nr:hypothetical protein [Pararoseomonas baculiformis]MBP0445979.1 hypothetical protein [Pararoseomonas baculiformis]
MIRTGRTIGLGALALLAGLAAPSGEAQAQERRFFQVAPGPRTTAPVLDTRPVLATNQAITVMDRAAINRWLCPNGGKPVRGRPGRCDGRGMARGGGGGADPDVAGWHADLPAPARQQIACPAGTVATQARANPGTVRCMPMAEEVQQASAQPSPAEAKPADPKPAPTETAEARESAARPVSAPAAPAAAPPAQPGPEAPTPAPRAEAASPKPAARASAGS